LMWGSTRTSGWCGRQPGASMQATGAQRAV
jgi:hypothetical protein